MPEGWERFHPRNAGRPPDWRWLRATLAVDGSWPLDRLRDDEWVCQAARLQRALRDMAGGPPDPGAMIMLEMEAPAAFWAHRYWTEGGAVATGAAWRDAPAAAFRHATEARVLAGQSAEEIARAGGAHVDDVTAYEKLFFDVRSRLGQPQYVLTRVIGPAVHRGLSARDYDVLWKLFGYFLGPHVLEALMYTFRGGPRVVAADAVEGALVAARRDDMTRHVAVLGKTWRTNPETQGVLFKAYSDMLRLEREGAGAATIEGTMRDMLATLGRAFTVGPPEDGEEAELEAAWGRFDPPGLAVAEALFSKAPPNVEEN